MQANSFFESVHPRLRIHVSSAADDVKARMLSTQDRSAQLTGRALVDITTLLLESLSRRWSEDTLVPVIVLRGGLLMLRPFQEAFGATALGMVAPIRQEHSALPTIAYGAVPVIEGARYVLLDVLVASGRSADVCLDWLARQLTDTLHEVEVVAPFIAAVGRDRLLCGHPSITVNCIWHAETVDDAGRMRGPGFDIGDCALGHFGPFMIQGGSP